MEIVGREDEVAALHAFFDRAGQGDGAAPAAVVLEGDAGIGKSTLWLAGVEAAREQGLRVLTARPAEAERGLAYVVLGDLFDGVLDEVLPALSAPRRRALEAALLVDETSEHPVDPRTLGVAVRTALQALAERTPVVRARAFSSQLRRRRRSTSSSDACDRSPITPSPSTGPTRRTS